MSRDVCNGFLDAICVLNEGSNTSGVHELEELPAATSLRRALAARFAALSDHRDPPVTAEAWNIQVDAVPGDWRVELRPVVHAWFFELPDSTPVDDERRNRLVTRFLEHLHEIVGDARAWRVEVTPPVWYECTWQDVAFEATGARRVIRAEAVSGRVEHQFEGRLDRWLLHFGITD